MAKICQNSKRKKNFISKIKGSTSLKPIHKYIKQKWRYISLYLLATELIKLLENYKPETAKAKKERLTEQAKLKAADGKYNPPKRPNTLTFGINEVTHAVETKKAKLVVIAHDVDPIEVSCVLFSYVLMFYLF